AYGLPNLLSRNGTMIIQNLAALNLAQWQTIVAPVVGLICAGMVLIASRYFGRKPALEPVMKPETQTPDPFEGGSLTERRIAPRLSGKPLRVSIHDAHIEATPFEGWVMDRSMGGLCLATDRA